MPQSPTAMSNHLFWNFLSSTWHNRPAPGISVYLWLRRKGTAWSKVVGDWGPVPIIQDTPDPPGGSVWVDTEAPSARWAQPCGAAFPAASILGGAEGELCSAGEPGVRVGAFRLGFWSCPICSSDWPHSRNLGTVKEGRERKGGAFLGSSPIPGVRSAVRWKGTGKEADPAWLCSGYPWAPSCSLGMKSRDSNLFNDNIYRPAFSSIPSSELATLTRLSPTRHL